MRRDATMVDVLQTILHDLIDHVPAETRANKLGAIASIIERETLAERERCIRICEARAELWQKTLAARSEVAYARDEARSRSNEARAIRDLIEAAAEEPQADA